MAAALATLAWWPDPVDRSFAFVIPAGSDAHAARAALPEPTLVVHGALAGDLAVSPGAREARRVAGSWTQTSPFDRQFKELLSEIYKASHPRPGQWSLAATIQRMLTLSGLAPDRLREETVLDPDFGEVSVSLDLKLGRGGRSFPRLGETSSGDSTRETVREFEADLTAALASGASDDLSASDAAYARAPIGVNTSASSAAGSLIMFGDPAFGSTTITTNAGGTSLPGASGYALPSPAVVLAGNPSWAGGYGNAAWILNAPPRPLPAPNWNGYAPATTLLVSRSGGSLQGKLPSTAGVSSSSTVYVPAVRPSVSAAPFTVQSVASPVATHSTVSTHSVEVPAFTGSSGATLTTSLVTAPGSSTGSVTLQPQSPGTSFIFVGDTSGNTVKEYNASTGAFVTGSTISLPSGSQEISVAAVPTALYVADFGTGQVTAYSLAPATLFQPLAGFATITGLQPNAITLSSNGQSLYVASGNGTGTSTVKEYNALTGATISSAVFTPISASWAYSLTLSTDNSKLYVGDVGNQAGTAATSVKEYNATSGAQIVTFSLTGTVESLYPGGLAMTASGQNLLVVNESAPPAGNVQEYNATTGASVSFSLSPAEGSSNEPTNIVSFGNTMYISDEGQPNVTEYTYTTSTGTQVSTGTFDITGTSFDPYGLAIIPEPSTALLLLGSGAMFFLRRRRPAV